MIKTTKKKAATTRKKLPAAKRKASPKKQVVGKTATGKSIARRHAGGRRIEREIVVPEVPEHLSHIIKRGTGTIGKYATPEELLLAGEAYILECQENKTPLTVTGLTLALGYRTKTAMSDIADRKDPGFSDVVEYLRTKVENYLELHTLSASNPAGAIFNLKANYGWKEPSSMELTGKEGRPVEVVHYDGTELARRLAFILTNPEKVINHE